MKGRVQCYTALDPSKTSRLVHIARSATGLLLTITDLARDSIRSVPPFEHLSLPSIQGRGLLPESIAVAMSQSLNAWFDFQFPWLKRKLTGQVNA